MLSDLEVLASISKDFPELDCSETVSEAKKPCSVLNAFSVYASTLIQARDWSRLKDCFSRIHKIYGDSSNYFKAFIENIFVYRIGTAAIGSGNREKLLGLMPTGLRDLVLQQYISSNI